jgi:two-component system NtrC family sensor kinase
MRHRETILDHRESSTSDDHYHALFHHANDAIFLLDENGQHILDANQAAEKLSGYNQATLLHLEPRSLMFDITEWGRVLLYHQACPIEHTPLFSLAPSNELESLLRTSSGKNIPVSVSISRIPCNDRVFLLVIARDMSKRWQMIHQLIQTEKLTSMGRLVHAIAHEMNNPLQAIHNSLHLVTNQQQNNEKCQRVLRMAQDEVNHLTGIVQQVLEFYRSSREGMRPTDLHKLLKAVLKLVGRKLRSKHVRVVCDWHPRLPQVLAIGSHLKQVYLNLIYNALESMPHGGVLTIRTYVVNDGEGDAEMNDPEPAAAVPASLVVAGHWFRGLSVVIEFSDTGTGIAADDLAKVFEPFYTTRIEHTGLGLAISYSIVEQHQGELSVSSTEGQGTTFRMRLPVAT